MDEHTEARNKAKRAAAVSKYRKAHVNQIQLRFFPAHAKLYDHLIQQPNRSEYLRELIREEMQKSRE